jgi:hypothetical protein
MKSIGIFIFLVALTTMVVAQKNRTVFDDVNIEIEPVYLINSVASDISPTFVNDSIYFSSVSEKYFNNAKREKQNMDFYNIYSASIDENGIVSSPRILVPEFDHEYHEGPADYCEATGELFVTVSNADNFEEIQKMIPVENIRLRLVVKKKIDGKWQPLKELPFNDKKFNFAQPAISVTGDTLVFSSDLKPNYGSTDLFMSIRRNGEWSSPVNLGSEINTAGSELFPTFISGDILSFASNGRIIKQGGLDIYYTHFPKLDKVEILSTEINSPYDDFGLIIHKNGKVGYFTSNRNSQNSDDIYKIDIQKLHKIFNGMVTDINSNLPIPNAEITLSNCNGGIINKVFSDSVGNFSFEIMRNECLQIKTSKEKYENELMNISSRDYLEFRLKPKQIYEIFVLDAGDWNPIEGVTISCNDEINLETNSEGIISLTNPFPVNCEMLFKKEGYLIQTLTPDFKTRSLVTRDTIWFYKNELNKNFVLSNISTVSGELRILQEATSALNRLIKIMEVNPDIKVELGWHTDSKGSDADNLRLSQNRADLAVNYIASKGIEKDRIITRGYGESQLVNKCKDGVKCTDEEHKVNRRIEIKIIESIPKSTLTP